MSTQTDGSATDGKTDSNQWTSSLTRRRLGPQRRSRVTATNGLPPQSRNGNTVVIAAELVGPFVTWSTWWTFPCRVWGRPTDSSTWRSMAWCAEKLSGNLTTCPNMALRPLVIRSDTGARPVRKETSELRTKSYHLTPLHCEKTCGGE